MYSRYKGGKEGTAERGKETLEVNGLLVPNKKGVLILLWSNGGRRRGEGRGRTVSGM